MQPEIPKANVPHSKGEKKRMKRRCVRVEHLLLSFSFFKFYAWNFAFVLAFVSNCKLELEHTLERIYSSSAVIHFILFAAWNFYRKMLITAHHLNRIKRKKKLNKTNPSHHPITGVMSQSQMNIFVLVILIQPKKSITTAYTTYYALNRLFPFVLLNGMHRQ